MPFFHSYSSFQVLGLPWPFLALALVLCLMLSALGFRAVEYFVSLGYAASIAGQAIVFPILYWHTMGGAALLQSALLLAYGLRLGLFIAHRDRLPSFRTQQAENTARGARVVGGPLKVAIWLGVSLFYVLLFLPALLTMSAQQGLDLAPLPAGLALMTAGLALEASADWQKSRFKKQYPSRFCDVGLYRIVRFPNYLGELVFWCGLWVSALPTYRTLPVWVAASLGFLLIVLVMMGASRRLEVKQGKNYGSDTTFEAYSRRVPILFPFVPIYSLQSRKLAQT